MPEFLGITKPVPGARGEVLPTLVAGQVCRWGSPSIPGGHHGFERDRLLTALSLNRPALRGPPARPEAPKKPAMLGQEHRQLSSDGEGTAVSRALAILGTASPPAMMEASPGPKGAFQCRRRTTESQHGPVPRGRKAWSWWLGCAFSSQRETGPGRPGRRLPHRCYSPGRQEVEMGWGTRRSRQAQLCQWSLRATSSVSSLQTEQYYHF